MKPYKARRRKKTAHAIVLVMVLMFILPAVAAMDWDNVKDYDSVKKEYTITNALGLGEDIATITLDTPQVVMVMAGEDRKVAEFTINNLGDEYENALKEMEFFNIKDENKSIEREFKYKLKVISGVKPAVVYKKVCTNETLKNGTKVEGCGSVPDYFINETTYRYIDLGDVKDIGSGTYTIGVFTDVKKGDHIEWIPTMFGERLEAWAEWTESFNTKLILYWKLDETSGLNAVESVSGYYNGTVASTANWTPAVINNGAGQYGAGTTQNINFENIGPVMGQYWTISRWIKYWDIGNNWMFYGGSDIWGSYGWHPQPTVEGKMKECIGAVGQCFGGTDITLPGFKWGTWAHFVTQKNETGAYLYMNGTNVANISNYTMAWTGTWHFGTAGAGNNNNHILDEVGVWNRSLTETEITNLYNGGSGIQYVSDFDNDPNVTIFTPVAGFNTSISTVSFECNITDDKGAVNLSLWIDQNLNYTVTNTSSGQNLTLQTDVSGLIEGWHNWTCAGADYADAVDWSDENRTINYTIIGSDVTLQLPADNYISNLSGVTLNFTTEIGAAGVVNITLWIDGNRNITIFNTTSFQNMSLQQALSFTEGSYDWTGSATDNLNVISFAASNYTLEIDQTAPTLTIESPTGTYVTDTLPLYLSVNFTALDTNIGFCSFNTTFNATMTYIGSCANSSVTTNITGTSTIYVYANDTSGNQKVTSSSFTIQQVTLDDTLDYINVTEGQIVNFNLTIIDSNGVDTHSGNLIWNGSDKGYDTVTSGTTTAYYYVDFEVPKINNETYTVSYYWNYTSNGSNPQATATGTQNLHQLSFAIMNVTHNVTFVNFTVYDVEDGINKNATMDAAFTYSRNNVNRTFNYSQSNSTTSHFFKFRLLPSWTDIQVNATLAYTAPGYNINYYYMENANLSNITSEIPLYVMNETKTTLTTLHIQDQYQDDVEDVIIQIQRYDVGKDAYDLFGMAKTNFEGDDIVYLSWYDTFYKFVLIEKGIVVRSTSPTKISATPMSFTLVDTGTFVYDEFKDVSYSLTYNNNTRNFVLTFADASGQIGEGCLRIIKRGLTDTVLNDTCLTATSGTLYHTLASTDTGHYFATFYATGSPYYVFGTIYQNIEDIDVSIREAIGSDDSTIYAIIAAGVITFLGLFSPAAAVMLTLVGLIFAATMGFLLLDIVTFVGLVVIGLIIMWSMKQR